MALSRAAFSNHSLPTIVSVLAGFYIVGAVIFGLIMYKHPGARAED